MSSKLEVDKRELVPFEEIKTLVSSVFSTGFTPFSLINATTPFTLALSSEFLPAAVLRSVTVSTHSGFLMV